MKGFISKDGRTVSTGQKVMVYRNLHNGLWSIKDVKSDLVLGYAEEVTLKGLPKSNNKKARRTFHVIESGRQKVLKEKKKNVHAYVIGYLENFTYEALDKVVYYNPYKVSQFVAEGTPIYDANRVSMNCKNGMVTAGEGMA